MYLKLKSKKNTDMYNWRRVIKWIHKIVIKLEEKEYIASTIGLPGLHLLYLSSSVRLV